MLVSVQHQPDPIAAVCLQGQHTNHVTSRRSVYKVNTHKKGHIAVISLQGGTHKPGHIAAVSLQRQHTQTRSHRGGQFKRWNTHKPGHIAAVSLKGGTHTNQVTSLQSV